MTSVIYHAGHFGFLWKFAIHKMKFHKDDDALFLINRTQIIGHTLDYLESFHERFVFGKIRVIDDGLFFGYKNEIDANNAIVNFFDSLFLKNNINLSNLIIYSGFDTHSSFSLYLTLKKINFIMCDPGNGDLLVNRYRLNYTDRIGAYANTLERNRALNSDNPYVSSVVCFSKIERDFGKDCLYIDCESLLSLLSRREWNNLLKMYNGSIPEGIEGDYDMLICSSAWVLRRGVSSSFFIKMYADMADYCLQDSNRIIIKPHPNADFKEEIWSEHFDVSNIFRGFIPSQIISFLFKNNPPRRILSTGSTGTSFFPNSETINLTPTCLDSYTVYDKLYAIMTALNQIFSHFLVKSSVDGMNLFINSFIKFLFPKNLQAENSRYVVSLYRNFTSNNVDSFDKSEILIDFNVDNISAYSETLSRCWDKSVILEISVLGHVNKLNSFVIVYSSNESMRKQLRELKFYFEKKFSKETITLTPLCFTEYADFINYCYKNTQDSVYPSITNELNELSQMMALGNVNPSFYFLTDYSYQRLVSLSKQGNVKAKEILSRVIFNRF